MSLQPFQNRKVLKINLSFLMFLKLHPKSWVKNCNWTVTAPPKKSNSSVSKPTSKIALDFFSKPLSIERFPFVEVVLRDLSYLLSICQFAQYIYVSILILIKISGILKNSPTVSTQSWTSCQRLILKRKDIAALAFQVHNMFTISINRLVYCPYRCTLSFLTFQRVSWT